MKFSGILEVLFFLLALLTLSLASPTKSPIHKHEQHHRHKEHHKDQDKEKKTETPATSAKSPSVEPFPGIFGIKVPANIMDIFGLAKGPKLAKNVKTKTNTTTKVNGGFKTVTTVTQQIAMDKNNKTHVVGQSVQSVTLPVNSTKKGGKNPGSLLDLFNPFGSYVFDDEPEPECSPKKPCKKKGTYCDQLDWECKPTIKPGLKCNQPDQCASKEGKFGCIWGKCTLLSSVAGYSGRFCKKDSECSSDNMHCVPQDDVSEVSNICVPKPGEGQTCGRTVMFNFWPFRRSSRATSPCRKGLACVDVGYSGRMICRPEALLKHQEKNKD